MTTAAHISFEFFPPRTPEGKIKLRTVRQQLDRYNPEFYSVTYGAGGTTRETTFDTVIDINDLGSPVAPHLSFGGDNEETLLTLLGNYQDAGVKRVVALRGDMPSGMGVRRPYYANQLVELIRNHFNDHFEIFVACYPETHPEADSYDKDIYWLKEKFAAGANSAITQYFYNTDGYFYFIEQCHKAGIEQPIIPGIMPITNFKNLVRFSDNCGADIPRWIKQKLGSYEHDTESLIAFGTDVVTQLCEKLVAAGAPGLHFYTMNKAEPTTTILDNLNL